MKKWKFVVLAALAIGFSAMCTKGDDSQTAQPPGLQAITVRVQCDQSVSGFYLPGGHVDLLASVRNPAYPTIKLSKFLIQNVLLLEVKEESASPVALTCLRCCDSSGIPVPDWLQSSCRSWTVLTIAVSPDQAEKLEASEGTVWAVLHKPEGLPTATTPGVENPFDD